MPNEDLRNDTIRVSSPRKIWLPILGGALLLIALQIGYRFFSERKASSHETHLIEDPNRTVFREEDVRAGLEGLRTGRDPTSFEKLRARIERQAPEKEEPERERLGPIVVVRREEAKANLELPLIEAPKPIGLPLGTKMPALLKDKIFSFNVENQIEAELLKDVYYLGKLRLPKGTQFFGQVSILHSEDRVNIRFHRLLTPSGEEKDVRAVAHSLDGSGGIPGRVHKKWFKRIFTVTGKTALGALTLFTVPNRENAFSLDDQLRLTAAGNLSQEAMRELDQVKTTKAISVESHIPIQIVLLESV